MAGGMETQFKWKTQAVGKELQKRLRTDLCLHSHSHLHLKTPFEWSGQKGSCRFEKTLTELFIELLDLYEELLHCPGLEKRKEK